MSQPMPPRKVSPSSILGRFEVRQSYTDGLGAEAFLFENLLIRQHILTIIAESGGGKTTFLFYHLAEKLRRDGLTVWYIDADSPASDHKRMSEFANKHGINFIIPDVNEGTSAESLMADIKALADAQVDLAGYVLIFDTLKKFLNLMSKDGAKHFFVLMRKLTKLGASIVLSGHANKYRDKDGNLVFEGVGDIKSDSDELIIFEKHKKPDGSMDVTTVVDSDNGAKVRGIFEPFSFNISKSREITFHDKALKLADMSVTGVTKATPDAILQTAEQYLKSVGQPIKQGHLVQYVADKVEGQAGEKRVRELIVQRSVLKGDSMLSGSMFVFEVKEKNTHYYEMPEEKMQGKIQWDE